MLHYNPAEMLASVCAVAAMDARPEQRLILYLYINPAVGSGDMVSNIKKEGSQGKKQFKVVSMIKKEGSQGKRQSATKHLYPLTRAFVDLVKSRKQIRSLQSSISHFIHKEMEIGGGTKQNMYNASRPCFFANNADLTYDIEQKKIKKILVQAPPSKTMPRYSYRGGDVENELDERTKTYHVDYEGRAKHPLHVDIDMYPSDGRHFENFNLIQESDVDNRLTHRFLSLICHDQVFILKHLNSYLSSSNRKADAQQISKLIMAVTAQTNASQLPSGPFQHNSISHNIIPTADYDIHICTTSHEFTCAHDCFGLNIQKKIIMARYKNAGKSMNIPICEELIIQLKEPNTTGVKDSRCLTNSKRCLVLSVSIISATERLTDGSDQETHPGSSLHFFGDNALTICLNKETSSMLQDRTRLCARLAGKFCRCILDIHSHDKDTRDKCSKYFDVMFSDHAAYLGRFEGLRSNNKQPAKAAKDDQALALLEQGLETLKGDINDKNQSMMAILDRRTALAEAKSALAEAKSETGDSIVPPTDTFPSIQEKFENESDESLAAMEESLLLEIDRLKIKQKADIIMIENKRAVVNGAPGETTAKHISLTSFVIRQNVRSLIQVQNGEPCHTGHCESSQSFSIVTLNPRNGKNYVFIVTHFSGDKRDKKLNLLEAGPVQFFSQMSEPTKTSKLDIEHELKTMIQSDFDLEHELSLINF